MVTFVLCNKMFEDDSLLLTLFCVVVLQLRGGSRVLARPVSVSVFNRPEATAEQQVSPLTSNPLSGPGLLTWLSSNMLHSLPLF